MNPGHRVRVRNLTKSVRLRIPDARES